MKKKLSVNSNINTFFYKIKSKKRYFKNLKTKIKLLFLLSKITNKNFNLNVFLQKYKYFITYIIEIFFSPINTLITITNFKNKLLFSYSVGNFSIKGKRKKARYLLFNYIKFLFYWKLKFLLYKKIALHFKNIIFRKYWITKQLKKKIFIQVIKSFIFYPYNGCWQWKIWRKKQEKVVWVV